MSNAKTQDDGGLTALVMQCAFAVIAGQKTVTISTTGERPAGFPRGELLSVGTNGAHNYAVCPIKAMAWIHSRTLKAPNAKVSGPEAALSPEGRARLPGCAASPYDLKRCPRCGHEAPHHYAGCSKAR